MPNHPKRTLGPYEVREKIGEGGMGHVFKAYQPALNRLVAIKILSPRLVYETSFTERFQREAYAIARLHHPNILPVYDSGFLHNYYYIVMRYVPNSITLETLMVRGTPISKLIAYLIQIADALHYTHEQGIIHRDVKPNNILIDNKWALLSDFGLVKDLTQASQVTGPDFAGIGTPAYMSPEQVKGLRIDHRADIYALGIILHRILTGDIPHNAPTPLGIMAKRIAQPITPLREISPDIPQSLEEIAMRALAREPDHRYASATHFAEALQHAYQSLGNWEKVVLPPGIDTEPTIASAAVEVTDSDEPEQTLQFTLDGPVPRLSDDLFGETVTYPFASRDIVPQATSPAVTLPGTSQITAHLEAILQCHEYNRWATDEDQVALASGQDRYLTEEGKLLPIHASPYELEPEQGRIGLLKILRENRRAVALGEAGSGKTTALERLMWEIASRQGDKPVIPVLVRLLDFGGDLIAKVRDEIRARGVLKLSSADVKDWLESEVVEFAVMFDGMNEVPGPQRETFLPQITSLMNRYPYHRYIITSRVHDELWERLRQTFPDLTVSVVQPIREEQIKAYLRAHLGPRRWWQVWRKMDDRLKGLARRPLMLWLLKEAALDEEVALPRNRGELFQSFVKRTLRREKEKGGVTIPDYQKRLGLTALAWDMQVEHQLSIEFDKATQIVAQETGLSLAETSNLLKEASFNGLLYGDTPLRFMHQSLQEHFVANKLLVDVEAEMRTGPLRQFISSLISNQISERAQDDWWAEPFIHTAGLMRQPDWLIKRLAKQSPWLAYWCMDEGQEVLEKTRQIVEQSSTKQLSDPDVRVRRRAVGSLLLLNNARVMNYLPGLLADEDQGIGQQVYQAFLSQAEIPVEPLLPLLQDSRAYVRRWVVDLISQQEDLSVLSHLAPLLADEDEKVAELVYQTILAAPQPPVKPLVATLAGITGEGRPSTASTSQARTRIIRILAQRDKPHLTPQLIALLTDANPDIRQAVVGLLSRRNDPIAMPHLIPLLQDEVEKIGKRVYQILKAQKNLPQEPFIQMLGARRGVVRYWAVEILAQKNDSALIPYFTPLLSDKDETVSEAVYQVLSRYENLSPKQFLPRLNSRRASVRLRALKILTHRQPPDLSLLPVLIPLLADKNGEVGEAACQALFAYNYLSKEPLLALLSQRRPPVSDRIIRLLLHATLALKNKPKFIHIPAGPFWMGRDDTVTMLEKPCHKVYLEDYWISQQPVTVAQYNDYLTAIGRGPLTRYRPNHPVVRVSWTDATAYCEWLAKTTGLPVRLPTEADWEKAARGTQKRLYPWGNSAADSPKRCNTKATNIRTTVPAGHFSPAGDSPFGCQDMVGNVWEWTTTELRGYPYDPEDGREDQNLRETGRTVRGGSFKSEADGAHCTVRVWHYPNTAEEDIGFRVMIKF